MPAFRFELSVGVPDVFGADSPDARYAVIFEDDGRTGYLYAMDQTAVGDQKIQEAMLIYDVATITDRDRPNELILAWTPDSALAVLLINSYPHAVYDFERKRGYCRKNFPTPGKWGQDFRWDESVLDAFQKRYG